MTQNQGPFLAQVAYQSKPSRSDLGQASCWSVTQLLVCDPQDLFPASCVAQIELQLSSSIMPPQQSHAPQQPVTGSKPAPACSSRVPAWKSHSYDQACSKFLHSNAPTCSSMDVLFPHAHCFLLHSTSSRLLQIMVMLLHIQHEHATSASILTISPQQLPHSTLAIKSHEQWKEIGRFFKRKRK